MNNLESSADRIFHAALSAVDPYEAVRNSLSLSGGSLLLKSPSGDRDRTWDINGFDRIFVVGAGKAAVPMARACEWILKGRIDRGVVITKYGHSGRLDAVDVIEAGHPVPDESGLNGAETIVDLLKGAGRDDLVICLTSGGCSALLPLPVFSITLAEKQEMTGLLLRSGATIHEINAVRKHISRTKGGNLAKLAYPSTVVNLILSDVIGDNLDIIGSGPFVADPSTFVDAWGVIERYGLSDSAPPSVVKHIQSGLANGIEDTPKPGEACFANVANLVVGSNLMALEAARTEAGEMGFATLVLSSRIQGEARELAKFYGAIAQEISSSHQPCPPPVCVLGGGEPTVSVRGKGRGGRNTELALAFAIEARGLENIVFLSAGTDGTDGPTDAAGAQVSGRTYEQAKEHGFRPEDYLERNDSYTIFKETGNLVITGPTRTNVMDIHILLQSPHAAT